MPHEHENDPTLQSPVERRSLLSEGILRLRRLFVQVANITTLRTGTITERTPGAGVTTTSLWNFIASGAGGLTDYDVTVGDVATPDYGLIRIGNSVIGRTSYNVGDMDVDGAFILRNVGGPVTGQIEFCFTESGGSAIRFALPKSGAGNATYNPRSMLLAGPAVNNDDVVTVGYWQTNNSIFDNLACDTAGDGADLGVQNDLEVEGDIFTDSIKESTAAAGVTADGLLFKDSSLRLSTVADPGDAGAIPVTTSAYCPLVSGAAETRTLAVPSFIGQELLIYFKTDLGNVVVTCATTINETGNNTITFANTGEAVRLFAVEEGSNLRWRLPTVDGASLSTV